MSRPNLQDEARIHAAGYVVQSHGKGWTLAETADPTGYLMVGPYGCVSPTRWEAVAEALSRIEANEPAKGATDAERHAAG